MSGVQYELDDVLVTSGTLRRKFKVRNGNLFHA